MNTELITAGQLAQWPATRAREAQAHFPELMRRLLLETPEASEVSIRVGDGVALAGDDGVAVFSKPTKLLPAGRIRFEFGTNQDSKSKATTDYGARRPSASVDETFVFATPRRWQGKSEWASKRRVEGAFKDVLVLDADDLELWLQMAANAHVWISERLGFRPKDASTLHAWWGRFSESTEPALPRSLFVAGRAEEAKQLRQLLEGEPRVISVEVEWANDALGFMAEVFAALEENTPEIGFPTVVTSPEVWDRMIATPGKGALVALFAPADVQRAVEMGRHVITIVDSKAARRRRVDIKLPRLGRTEAAEAFHAAGVEWREADRYAVLARRSIPALLRRLSHDRGVQRPPWTRPPLANALAALMLANRWNDNTGDWQVLQELAQEPLDNLRQIVLEATQGADPAIRHQGQTFVFVSPEEAFLELNNWVSPSATAKWVDVAARVLLEPDPYAGLSATERFQAQLEGKSREYSLVLRRGIADSLALVGALAPDVMDADQLLSADRKVVKEVLGRVADLDNDATWMTLADVLPLLAEADPDAFLSALEDDLARPEPTIAELFQTNNDTLGLGSASNHHQLLWALEGLCWSSRHLVRACQILSRLSRFELPKNAGNTPVASLTSVLCGFARHTGADSQTHLEAIDACWRVDRKVGWSLLKSLWPKAHSWGMPPYEPRYQLWKPENRSVTLGEWAAYGAELTDRALEWAATDPSHLPWLIEALTTAAEPEADRILTFLESGANGVELSEELRGQLHNAICDIASRHERFEASEWAMPATRRARLLALSESFEPAEDARRLARLFGWHPGLPGIDLDDYASYSSELSRRRREALEVLLKEQSGWEQVSRLAAWAEAPSQVGAVLTTFDRVEVVEAMFQWAGSPSKNLRQAAGVWFGAMSEPSELQCALECADLSDVGLKTLLKSMPTSSRFWNVLREFPESASVFWSEAEFFTVPRDDLQEAVELLVQHGRAWAAIVVASRGIHEAKRGAHELPFDPELLISTLRAAASQEPDHHDVTHELRYSVGVVFDYLADSGVSQQALAQLEFTYFRLLRHHREPRALDGVLSSDPLLFVDLVCRVYLAEGEATRSEDGSQRFDEQAWLILHEWRGFPGRQEDGSLDEIILREWCDGARRQLDDVGRAVIGDQLIGQTFAHAPAGTDEIWPPEAIRDLIEAVASRTLEDGVVIGRRNLRGVTTRGVYDGGAQERELAEKYWNWSRRVQGRWPRSARVLRRIGDSYENDALWEDQEAQTDQDLD